MKRLTYITLILMVFAFAKANSQQTSPGLESYSFTLEEAIDFALNNNYQAINAKRDIAKALKQKWETTATGLPQITGTGNYNYQLKQPVSVLPGEIAGGEPGTFIPVVFSPKQNADITATLSQVIFDGSYIVALEASETFLDFSENANNKTKLEVRKGVINAYGGVLLSEENVDIITKNLETVNDNLEETKAIFENGLTEEEDVEQLQITALQLSNQLNSARRQTDIAMNMFQLALGIDLSTDVTLAENLESLAVKTIDLSLAGEDLVLDHSVDYQIAYNMTEQRRLEYKLERSKALPTVNGFINYGANAFSNDDFVFNSSNQWFRQSIAGVSISWPVFTSFGRKARTDRAKIAWDQAETDLERTSQQIRLDYETALNDYQLAIDTYYTNKQNLELAERIENKNQIKFTEGISTSFDLRQAQTQLYDAQSQYLNSMFQVITNKAALETVLNTPQYLSNKYQD
ncbi:Outer membrane protein TolC [Nonlabens sp. Hel1_33_55]|uniref:TolC family protein n=1 Tax=Nonlabens sp. Hel1_33_55 TaxID=1336802 RepID=UPI000875B9F8|nr:TolC family protein [Nonlabens sp. Hel1_33_55]SCY38599.1 Outer membrane protein TolC [Nonlabens sp. Hel1_33_55]